ncbi:MAG: hypothetical protein QOG54_2506 [Actinomycetota bacterium]|jgi:hypothetical protein|nr:hypothetical protein [Actinomycetota bacterium]
MKRSIRALIVVALLASLGLVPASAESVDKSDNVTQVARFPFTGGSELAWDGDYVYAGQFDGIVNRGEEPDQGGVYIFDVGGAKPKKIGYIHCPGNDNDVAIVEHGLLALGFHTNRCAPGVGAGVAFFDVSNPRKPTLLSSISAIGGHTITPYPGKPILYVNGGGLYADPNTIIDVSDPRKPKAVGSFDGAPLGCHDFSFHIEGDKKLGFCAGEGQVTIYDVSDPLSPAIISVIANPLVQFGHYALASPDGNLLVIDDEAFVAHECVSGQSPTGSAWFYDISNPQTPILAGRYAVGRGHDAVGTDPTWASSWCTSHHYNFVPGTRNLIISWFTGGVSVLDLTDPLQAKEIAYYMPDDAVTWTAHWYRGQIITNDMTRGVEFLKVKGLKEKS